MQKKKKNDIPRNETVFKQGKNEKIKKLYMRENEKMFEINEESEMIKTRDK